MSHVVGVRRLAWFLLAALTGACVADEPGSTSSSDVDRFEAAPFEVVVSGLSFPTQVAVAPDGRWFVVQLAGGENDATGEIVVVDATDGSIGAPVLTGLDKPTGVAVFDGRLWVQERRSLSAAELDGSGRVVAVDDLAFNGRSSGSLTVDGDRLLFATTGSLRNRTDAPLDPASSSGVLWAVDARGDVAPVAWGFKNAYAQARTPDGTLWTSEIADGVYDGEVARDEIVAVVEGSDHGWPHCVDDGRPVEEFGGGCDGVPSSLALFERGATPTSIVASPWEDGELLVSLWVTGEVVALSSDDGSVSVVFDGIAHPQQVFVDEGRVFVVDFDDGRILELSPPQD